MEKTTIYLPRDLRLYLKDAARRTGKSQADLIREAVETQRAAGGQPAVTIVGLAAVPPTPPASAVSERRREYQRHVEQRLAGERDAHD